MNIDAITLVYASIPCCLACLGFILAKEVKLAHVANVNKRLRYGGSVIL